MKENGGGGECTGVCAGKLGMGGWVGGIPAVFIMITGLYLIHIQHILIDNHLFQT